MAFNWATYQSATGCTKYGPSGAQALQTYLEDWFPGQTSLGICNCRVVRGGASYSHHAECRAYDEGHAVSVAGGQLAIATLNLLGPNGKRLGIDHMIVNRNPTGAGRGDPRIYSATSPNGRVYTGTHPHKDHNHIGLTRSAGANLTYATLVAVCGRPPSGGQQGDDMPRLPLRYGDKTEDVRDLQLDLNFSIGTGLKADGDYGPATAAEVKRWLLPATQADEDDGQVGSTLDEGHEVNAAMWNALQAEVIRKHTAGFVAAAVAEAVKGIGAGLSAGEVTNLVNQAVATHAAQPGREVHPHGHDEGQTGPAI